jgi:crotonobetainyl-CoA:carnitine CoA-transferase CaiB-like acyl-CoA transferase
MMARLKALIQKMNEYGVPLPMVRVDNKPSLTATFAVISFNTALMGQIGKISNFLGAVDLDSANYLFFGALAAYLGRRMSGDGKSVEVSGEENNTRKERD